MHQAECRHTTLIFQITEVGANLIGQQQAFVHHRTAGHAGNVVLVAVLQMQILNGSTGSLANDVELALQGILHNHIGTTANENLLEHRFFFAHRG